MIADFLPLSLSLSLSLSHAHTHTTLPPVRNDVFRVCSDCKVSQVSCRLGADTEKNKKNAGLFELYSTRMGVLLTQVLESRLSGGSQAQLMPLCNDVVAVVVHGGLTVSASLRG